MSHRPDRVIGLSRGDIVDGCAVVEMAGRDSIAATVLLAREGGLRQVLPTVACTATEYGDVAALPANVERLRRLLKPLGVEVLEPVVLGSPMWWRATVGRVNAVLSRLYGPWHICVGCHMYLHAVRAPLAWETGIIRQVGGERLQHKGRVKINQIRPAVEAYRNVLCDFGIGLELPLLELDDEEAILSLAGDWEEGEGQPGCVLSGNYRDLDGGVSYKEDRLLPYLDDYLVPVTTRILASLREGEKAGYDAIVRKVLAEREVG
ncbi:MAG: hypothetical protein C4536_04675 [Actinobacteria bacterium]|jgi:hypothetical protein|nr:MAG: hypothetical protein C4536_04675 [Actinomycetota bacterium]